jgi:hypothetical protein
LKKLIINILILIFLCLPAYTQVKGVDLGKAKQIQNNSKVFKNYEELLAYNGAYCITYPLAPIGLQRCMDKLKTLLSQNSLSWNNPHKDKSFVAANVNSNFEDYTNLHTSLQAQASEVNRTWELQDGWYISLNLTVNAYTIWFIPADGKK